MAFIPDDPNIRKVGDAITAEIFRVIFNNLMDLDQRASQSEALSGLVDIFNGDIDLSNFDQNDPVLFHYKATHDFRISDFRVQLFNKNGVASDFLIFDVLKSSNTNPVNFNSILTEKLSFDFSSPLVVNYSEKTGLINGSLAEIVAGQVIRVEISNKPINFSGKVLLSLGKE